MPACREAIEDGSCADGGIREAFVGGGWGGKTVPVYCGKSGARPWLNQKAPVAKGTEKGCAPGKVLCPAGLPGNAGASCLPGVRVAKVRPSGCGSRERHAQGRGLTSLPFFKYDRGRWPEEFRQAPPAGRTVIRVTVAQHAWRAAVSIGRGAFMPQRTRRSASVMFRPLRAFWYMILSRIVLVLK